MKYIVKLNGTYLNGFKSYTEAREFADDLRRVHPNWNVIVETAD